MKRDQLNALCKSDSQPTADAETPILDDTEKLTRRELLGLAAGTVTYGLIPALVDENGVNTRPFSFEHDPRAGIAVFKVNQEIRWLIETQQFTGDEKQVPRLKVKEKDKSIRFELRNATFPGTNLPAGMKCKIKLEKGEWRMEMRFMGDSYELEMPLLEWLNSAEHEIFISEKPKSHERTVCKFDDNKELKLVGEARAGFSRVWVLKLSGENIVSLHGLGGTIAANSITLSLPEADQPCVLDQRERRRTCLQLERQSGSWPIAIALKSTDGRPLIETDDQAFQRIDIEASVNSEGQIRSALRATPAPQAIARFLPARNLLGHNGKLFSLPLRAPLYEISFEPQRSRSLVAAQLEAIPSHLRWLHADGCSLELEEDQQAASFSLIGEAGRAIKGSCKLRLKARVFQLSDAFSDSMTQLNGVELDLVYGDGALLSPSSWGLTISAKDALATLQAPICELTGVVRHEDLVVLDFKFTNFRFESGPSVPRCVRDKPDAETLIAVTFPPQHISEEAFTETEGIPSNPPPACGSSSMPEAPVCSSSRPLSDPPVKSIIANPSQLVFKLPADKTTLKFTLAGLLDWSSFDQVVKETKGTPQNETSIEAPYHLLLSPYADTAWTHSNCFELSSPSALMPLRRHASLWHTRLTQKSKITRSNEAPAVLPRVRVLATRDTNSGGCNPFKMSLEPRQREKIKQILDNAEKYIRAERLMLSALGAWLRLDYVGGQVGEQLETWVHRSVMGRDYYVEISEGGCLCSYGHSCSFVQISERKIEPKGENRIAYLRTRQFLILREKERIYSSRDFPYKKIKITTGKGEEDLSTPLLDDPDCVINGDPRAFWPKVNGRKFLFQITATDWNDQTSVMTKPLIYVFRSIDPKNDISVNSAVVSELVEKYGLPEVDCNGQKVAYAPSQVPTGAGATAHSPPRSGDTVMETASMVFGSQKCSPTFEASDFINLDVLQASLLEQNNQVSRELLSLCSPNLMTLLREYNGSPDKPEQLQQGLKKEFDELIAKFNLSEKLPSLLNILPERIKKLTETDLSGEKLNIVNRVLLDFAFGSGIQKFIPFRPSMENAKVKIPALTQMLGNEAEKSIKYVDKYLEHGFDQIRNEGAVFAKFVGDNLKADFEKAKAGLSGLAVPQVDIDRLSRDFGAAGDIVKLVRDGDWAGLIGDAKILGMLELKDLLDKVGNEIFGDLELPKVPQFVQIPGPLNQLGVPEWIETKFKWNPKVKKENKGNRKPCEGNALFIVNGDENRTFELESWTRTYLKNGKTEYKVNTVLREFALNLQLIEITFKEFSFETSNDSKPIVKPQIERVEFCGALNFVKKLQDFLGNLLGRGFRLDIQPVHLTVGFGFELPTISLGAFTLRNISLISYLELPFQAAPIRVGFSFSERGNPFVMAVGIFGGGGFLGIKLRTYDIKDLQSFWQMIEIIEGQLEFGGFVGIDILDLAEGEVHAMAGIYFRWGNLAAGHNLILSGYLRMGGSLAVLGCSISAEFMLSLTYEPSRNSVRGSATLTVNIEILLVSEEIELPVERQFAGSDSTNRSLLTIASQALSSPSAGRTLFNKEWTATDQMEEKDWRTYFLAFANST